MHIKLIYIYVLNRFLNGSKFRINYFYSYYFCSCSHLFFRCGSPVFLLSIWIPLSLIYSTFSILQKCSPLSVTWCFKALSFKNLVVDLLIRHLSQVKSGTSDTYSQSFCNLYLSSCSQNFQKSWVGTSCTTWSAYSITTLLFYPSISVLIIFTSQFGLIAYFWVLINFSYIRAINKSLCRSPSF